MVHVKAGVAIEPSGDRGMLMSGVIVGDDVDVELGRGFEKGEPLLRKICSGGKELRWKRIGLSRSVMA